MSPYIYMVSTMNVRRNEITIMTNTHIFPTFSKLNFLGSCNHRVPQLIKVKDYLIKHNSHILNLKIL